MSKRRHLNKKQAILISVTVLLLVSAAVIAAFALKAPDEPGPETMRELFLDIYPDVRVSGMCNYMQFNYDELTNWAHTIAVVTPLDDLTHLRLNNRPHLLVEAQYDLGLAGGAGILSGKVDILTDFTAPRCLWYIEEDSYSALDARTDWQSVTLTTPYTDSNMTLDFVYAPNSTGMLAKLGDCIYKAG